jgi:cytidylate kinase
MVGISGFSGSGKSTLGRSPVVALDGTFGSFGDYVRHLAQERGASTERRFLQEIGEAEVRHDVGEFVRDFLAWATPSVERALVVDGVRHVAVDDALRGWSEGAGRRYVRVHVIVSSQLRPKRRTVGDGAALKAIDSHPVEREAAMVLRLGADLVVDETWNDAAILRCDHRVGRSDAGEQASIPTGSRTRTVTSGEYCVRSTLGMRTPGVYGSFRPISVGYARRPGLTRSGGQVARACPLCQTDHPGGAGRLTSHSRTSMASVRSSLHAIRTALRRVLGWRKLGPIEEVWLGVLAREHLGEIGGDEGGGAPARDCP